MPRRIFILIIFASLIACTINIQNGTYGTELIQDKPTDVVADTEIPLIK
jgi:hypothetical protein